MNGVELRRLGPREHSLLAMLAQINVSAKIVGIAQMIDEADQRIDQVWTRLAGLSMYGRRPKMRR